MTSQPAPDNGLVMPHYRGDGDPDFAVPAAIHCPACPGIAGLRALIVGYGYDCATCGKQIVIIC